MHLIETDLAYCIALPDEHGQIAEEILTAGAKGEVDLSVSSLSFLELDLLLKTRNIKLNQPADVLFDELTTELKECGVSQTPVLEQDTAQSIRFRRKYGLTFFDSYHAACAVRTGATLVSFDQAYSRVPEIRYQRPEDVLSELKL